MIRLRDISLPAREDSRAALLRAAARELRVREGDILEMKLRRRAVDFLTGGEMLSAGSGESLCRLSTQLIDSDWFQTFPDFNAYVVRKTQAMQDYATDPARWARMSLINVAKAGFFSSDRTIEEYNRDIWHLG